MGVVGAYGLAWWFPAMVTSYFDVSPALAWTSFVAVAIALAGVYCGVFAAWLAWLAARGAASPIVVAAGWTAGEFARVNLWEGNPWALFGYSQVGWPRLMQIADATGPYGVTLLLVAVNACVAGVVAPALRGRRPIAAGLTVAAVFVVVLGYGTWRLSEPFAIGEPVQVSVIQAAVAGKLRRQPEGPALALERNLALTRAAAATHPGLVFWPENAVDVYLQNKSPERDAVLGMARDLGTDLILGAPAYTRGAAGLHYHNSVFLVRRGQLAGRYDKLRLLPFAERELGAAGLEPGREPYLLRAGVGLVGTFVCFEAMYPNLVRRLAVGGAEVLANLSNDAWFGHAAPAQHLLDIASVRAIENRRYLVRATSTGFSAVIDPHGRVLARSALAVPQVLSEVVRRSRVRTPYQRWGDAGAWAAVALVVAVTLHQLAAGRRRPTAQGETS
jgi:apolipoprotein N-acyltransferase